MKYTFDNSELYKRIKRKFGSLSNFAEEIDISLTTLSLKLNNRSGISRNEIIRWSAALDIPNEEIGMVFFQLM